MSDQSFYHVEVAPVVVLPLNRPQIFSYQSKKSLTLGSVIRIPFGSREIDGIVYGVHKVATRPPAWMKAAGKTGEEAFVTEVQRKLAESVSHEYFAPLGRTLRHFLPKRTKSRKVKVSAALKEDRLEKFSETAGEKTFLEAYKKLSPGRIGAYNPESFREPKRLLVALARKTIREKKQILILVPEITLFPALVAFFQRFFLPEETAVLHSKLTGSQYFEAWERVRSDTAHIVLATRQGLFAPFSNLGLVMVTEVEDESYKQWDMSPRYDARRVARILASLSGARLLYSSVTPSLETFLAIEEKRYVALTPLFSNKALGESAVLINLKFERFEKNASPLAKSLQAKIRSLLLEKEQVLLYVNRQGLSFFSVCENCKNIFRCPRCSRALINTAEGSFHCRACGYKTALFPGCPTCRHLSFRHIGFGTERIEREVKKLFPTARVFRADSSTMQERKASEELYRRGSKNEIDILIGTQMILNDPPLPKLGLVAIIDADSLLSFPDFRADEQYFQLLSRTAHQAGEKKDGVWVQTFHPESTINQRVIELSPAELYRGILEDRRDLKYPPCSRAVLLTCAERNAGAAKAHLAKTREALEKILKKINGKLTLLSEIPQYKKRERRYEYKLLLQIPADDILPPPLVTALEKLTPPCRIDVDPLSFF